MGLVQREIKQSRQMVSPGEGSALSYEDYLMQDTFAVHKLVQEIVVFDDMKYIVNQGLLWWSRTHT